MSATQTAKRRRRQAKHDARYTKSKTRTHIFRGHMTKKSPKA